MRAQKKTGGADVEVCRMLEVNAFSFGQRMPAPAWLSIA